MYNSLRMSDWAFAHSFFPPQVPLGFDRQSELFRSHHEGARPEGDARADAKLPNLSQFQPGPPAGHQHQDADDCHPGATGVQAVLIPVEIVGDRGFVGR